MIDSGAPEAAVRIGCNGAKQAASIAARWRSSTPQLVVIDDLLTEAALERLRRFCWGSTIRRKVYADGYLGAPPECGFACPLLAQISEELRSTYPEILEQYPLLQFWGFKHDSTLSGIKMHCRLRGRERQLLDHRRRG